MYEPQRTKIGFSGVFYCFPIIQPTNQTNNHFYVCKYINIHTYTYLFKWQNIHISFIGRRKEIHQMFENDVKTGRTCYVVIHKYKDEWNTEVKEITDICENEDAADKIIREQERMGLDSEEEYWKEERVMWR